MASSSSEELLLEQWTDAIENSKSSLEREDLRQVTTLNSWEHLQEQLKHQYYRQIQAVLQPGLEKFKIFFDRLSQTLFPDLQTSHIWGLSRLIVRLVLDRGAVMLSISNMYQKIGNAVDSFEYMHNSKMMPQFKETYIRCGVVLVKFLAEVIHFLRSNEAILDQDSMLRNRWIPLQDKFTQVIEEISELSEQLSKRCALVDVNVRSLREDLPWSNTLVKHQRFEDVFTSSSNPFSSDPARLPCFVLPPVKTPRFFGCEEVLAQLAEWFDESELQGSFMSVALHGLAGVGKSRIALQYAEEQRQLGSVDALLWVQAETAICLQQSFIRIATKLGLNIDTSHSPDDSKTLVLDWLARTQHRWLVIYDNAQSIELICDYWPRADRGRAIITTRDHSFAFGLADRELEVISWDVDIGKQFLTCLLGSNTHLRMREIEELSQQLSGHALATCRMADMIHRRSCFVPSFRELFSQDLRTTTGSTRSCTIGTLWLDAFEKLGPEAHTILGVLSFMQPENIPQAVFQSSPEHLPENLRFCSDVSRFSEAIELLLSLPLIRAHGKTRTFSVHRLVQTTFRNWLSIEDRQRYWRDAVCIISQIFPRRDSFAQWLMQDEHILYTPHVLQLSKSFAEESLRSVDFKASKFFCDLAVACQRHLLENGSYADADNLIEVSSKALLTLDPAEQNLILQAAIASHKGQLLIQQGKIASGISWLQQSYKISSTGSSNDGRQIAWVAETLANAFTTGEHFEIALKWHVTARKHWLSWARESSSMESIWWPATLQKKNATDRSVDLSKKFPMWQDDILVRSVLVSTPNLNLKDSHGNTLLITAVQNCQHLMVAYLIEQSGIELDAKNEIGRTALSYAAEMGALHTIITLVETGKVNLNSEDRASKTPLSWAISQGQDTVIRWLRQHGAEDRIIGIFTDSGYASNHNGCQDFASTDLENCNPNPAKSNASLSNKRQVSLCTAFASELLKPLQGYCLVTESLCQVVKELPEFLRYFKLQLNLQSPAINEEISTLLNDLSFVVRVLSEQWSEMHNDAKSIELQNHQSSSVDPLSTDNHADPSLEDKFRLLNWDPELNTANMTITLEALPLEQSELLPDIPDSLVPECSTVEPTEDFDLKHVISSSAFTWLSNRLVNQFRLSEPLKNKISEIRNIIYTQIPAASCGEVHTNYSVTFYVACDVPNFLKCHNFQRTTAVAEILNSFVSLTSDGRNTQALTCSDYLCQTWPESGASILSLVAQICQESYGVIDFHGSSVQGWYLESQLCVNVVGIQPAILQLAEQLAWVGSVFQTSSKAGNVILSTPVITNLERQSPKMYAYRSGIQISEPHFCWQITYDLIAETDNSQTDRCWYPLFRYPVVAQGFPILRRGESLPGLEMSLSTMLTLSQSRHVGKFSDRIVIKGFSSIFVLTQHYSGSSVWHYSGDIDGPYISYTATTVEPEFRELESHEILGDRHFVGWCSKVNSKIGSFDFKSTVQLTDLPRPSADSPLHEHSLYRPKRIRLKDACYTDDIKTPRRSYHLSFVEKLKRLESKVVILWDTHDKRGWLVDGTNALLHLVLASLNVMKESPWHYSCRFDPLVLRQPATHNADSAAWILLDEHNLGQSIMHFGGEAILFRDRVEDLYEVLNNMIEQQIMSTHDSKKNDHNVDNNNDNDMPIWNLTGWDFAEIADSGYETLFSKELSLDKDCCGWLSFLHDVSAVTLFGKGFGELFTSMDVDACYMCASVPRDNYYLAASVRHLNQIMRIFGGNSQSRPKRLTSSTFWPILPCTFEPASHVSCGINRSNKVQVLIPDSLFNSSTVFPQLLDHPPCDGAVIFGAIADSQHLLLENTKKELKPIVESIPTEDECRFSDSGIGGSISSSDITLEHSNVPDVDDYTVAIICAIPQELRAVRLLFDTKHDSHISLDYRDSDMFVFGDIAGHNVVAAALAAESGGNRLAATVMKNLRRSFQHLRFCLLVGIGSGIPLQHDIRLGDVVVGLPNGKYSGVMKHKSYGLAQYSSLQQIYNLQPPPQAILSAISNLESDPNFSMGIGTILYSFFENQPSYRYPGPDMDRLHVCKCLHVSKGAPYHDCVGPIVERKPRSTTVPRVHYGLIASGDHLLKDAITRDSIGRRYGALCFETGAADIVNILPTVVVRGISDYCDGHKDDHWQRYASAAAAAYAKLILGKLRTLKSDEVTTTN